MSARRTVPSASACAATLVLVKLALLTIGFGRLFALSQRLLRARPAERAPQALLAGAARKVALAAAFFPGRALCLEQSVTLWLLLRRRGVQADLRLGVRPYPFGAHAWVEHGGVPVNEDPELVRSFATLPSFAR